MGSPVDPKPATREPGTAFFAVSSTWRNWARTSGELTLASAGSFTTGTSGGLSPPLP